ncbi:hypothetical protein [Catellatospora tritici]|uniref:hypothetical protein n=1 Tax=Catellatospora tritici TaxID=2851566 RepID=UPI001C2D33FC|nr:hypothetical protein [Catellatospora tritici]MBV1856591.1 hypothetical protein [Catellatospora tritici]
MGFGYKTQWIAVRDGEVDAVSRALGLVDPVPMGWDEGADAAYAQGVYVTPPVHGWVLAHGRHLTVPDPGDQGFAARLEELSEQFGEVQFFGTHRVVEYHAWVLARGGALERGYCYVGDRGEVPLFVGEPTPVECELGKGLLPLSEDCADWGDSEWERWHATTPSEDDVMAVAARWSVDPSELTGVPGPGLYAATVR